MMVPALVTVAIGAIMLSTPRLWGEQPSTGRVLAATAAGIVVSVIAIAVVGGSQTPAGWTSAMGVVLVVTAGVVTYQGTHREVAGG